MPAETVDCMSCETQLSRTLHYLSVVLSVNSPLTNDRYSVGSKFKLNIK